MVKSQTELKKHFISNIIEWRSEYFKNMESLIKKFFLSKNKITRILTSLTANQQLFRAGNISWNQGTSVNNHLHQEKERSRRAKSLFFLLETLKNFTVNEKFNRQMTPIRVYFPKIRALFSNFRKRQGRPHPFPSPLLVTRLFEIRQVNQNMVIML